MLKPPMTRAAEFSEDGLCRWNLRRLWEPSRGLVLYCGLNASLAGAKNDDMTVTKGIGFALVWGFGGTMHGNAYPFITPYPSKLARWELARCTEGEIDKNDAELLKMAREAALVVLAWGSFPRFKERFRKVARMLAPFKPVCLGRTKDGYPKHISRIGYCSQRQPWSYNGEA